MRGDNCPYAHNVFEYWLHPTRYRTQLCNDMEKCNRKVSLAFPDVCTRRSGRYSHSLGITCSCATWHACTTRCQLGRLIAVQHLPHPHAASI